MTASIQALCKRAGDVLIGGDAYTALSLYAQVVDATPDAGAHGCAVPAHAPAPGSGWARRLLLLGRIAAGLDTAAKLRDHVLIDAHRLRGRICLVVGTTGSQLDLPDADALLDAAFAEFSGTVISGGTGSGVAHLVAVLGERYPQRIRTVGYAPDDTGEIDHRYHHLQFTRQPEFSPWEALQTWTDLLAAPVDPTDVAVLGLGGGRISAAEYRIALSLRARVGIIDGLGRAGSQLLDDPVWASHPQLQRLPWNPRAVRAFVCGDVPQQSTQTATRST